MYIPKQSWWFKLKPCDHLRPGPYAKDQSHEHSSRNEAGAAGGAVTLVIVWFSWCGSMTGGKAEATESMQADAAAVEALTQVCVAKFRRDAAFETNVAALKKVDSWSQGDFIEKVGWTTVAESKVPPHLSSVAKACGEILTVGLTSRSANQQQVFAAHLMCMRCVPSRLGIERELSNPRMRTGAEGSKHVNQGY